MLIYENLTKVLRAFVILFRFKEQVHMHMILRVKAGSKRNVINNGGYF